MADEIIYLLCAATGFTCAVLLWRGFRQNQVRLLFWSSLCFLGLALNNLMLFVDVRVLPEQDLYLLRSVPAVVGMALLLYGLIWERDL